MTPCAPAGIAHEGEALRQVLTIFKREFAAYFATPLAYVFIVIFLLAMGAFTFYIGHFYDNEVADLSVFFGYHPWLYLFLVPALSMRLWAEERRSGTMELLRSPCPFPSGRPCSANSSRRGPSRAWRSALTLSDLAHGQLPRQPRQRRGVIVASYIGSLFMAGGYLAIGSAISATTSNQGDRVQQ